jgi:hypothetical protein
MRLPNRFRAIVSLASDLKIYKKFLLDKKKLHHYNGFTSYLPKIVTENNALTSLLKFNNMQYTAAILYFSTR